MAFQRTALQPSSSRTVPAALLKAPASPQHPSGFLPCHPLLQTKCIPSTDVYDKATPCFFFFFSYKSCVFKKYTIFIFNFYSITLRDIFL